MTPYGNIYLTPMNMTTNPEATRKEKRIKKSMMIKQRLHVLIKLKSLSEFAKFEGYGSVFGVKDTFDDVLIPLAHLQKSYVSGEKKRCTACYRNTNWMNLSVFIVKLNRMR
ncbi:MAG: hypothetical protein ACTS73_07205 [Arsenophonus sp. NEOnobi-MAG3]